MLQGGARAFCSSRFSTSACDSSTPACAVSPCPGVCYAASRARRASRIFLWAACHGGKATNGIDTAEGIAAAFLTNHGSSPQRQRRHGAAIGTNRRALKLPEILSHIFLCIVPNRDSITNQIAWDPTEHQRGLAALARCFMVSKLWHAEALPHLWPRPYSTSLDELLAHAGPVAAVPRKDNRRGRDYVSLGPG